MRTRELIENTWTYVRELAQDVRRLTDGPFALEMGKYSAAMDMAVTCALRHMDAICNAEAYMTVVPRDQICEGCEHRSYCDKDRAKTIAPLRTAKAMRQEAATLWRL